MFALPLRIRGRGHGVRLVALLLRGVSGNYPSDGGPVPLVLVFATG